MAWELPWQRKDSTGRTHWSEFNRGYDRFMGFDKPWAERSRAERVFPFIPGGGGLKAGNAASRAAAKGVPRLIPGAGHVGVNATRSGATAVGKAATNTTLRRQAAAHAAQIAKLDAKVFRAEAARKAALTAGGKTGGGKLGLGIAAGGTVAAGALYLAGQQPLSVVAEDAKNAASKITDLIPLFGQDLGEGFAYMFSGLGAGLGSGLSNLFGGAGEGIAKAAVPILIVGGVALILSQV